MKLTGLRSLGLSLVLALFTSAAAMGEALPLKRGIGLHEWLNWAPLGEDGTYRRPPYQDVTGWLTGYRPLADWPPGSEFERIRNFGFDFVRLTVDPGPLLSSEGAERQEALAVLEAAVREVTSAGLKVVFNFHPNSQVPEFSPQQIEGSGDAPSILAYRQMVVEAAQMLAGVGVDKVALEPFNEPAYYPCDDTGTEDWQEVLAAQIHAIRAVSADLTIIATGACGGSITGLTDIDPSSFDDPAILYSFHMYEPHAFTHQREEGGWYAGLPWPTDGRSRDEVVEYLRAAMEVAGLDRLAREMALLSMNGALERYFAEGWGEAQLQERFDAALDWAIAYDIPPQRLFMGEFGVIALSANGSAGAFDADRYRYIEAVRTKAEQQGIAWSVWEYSNPYGMSFIVPVGPAVPDTGLVEALGLPPAAQ
ncbi:MAG: glycoside hydrolase family 5 protein [Devosia sp.]